MVTCKFGRDLIASHSADAGYHGVAPTGMALHPEAGGARARVDAGADLRPPLIKISGHNGFTAQDLATNMDYLRP